MSAPSAALMMIRITCDDKLIKKSRKEDVRVPVYNPIEFVIKEDLQ